jgi:hypothetical protein
MTTSVGAGLGAVLELLGRRRREVEAVVGERAVGILVVELLVDADRVVPVLAAICGRSIFFIELPEPPEETRRMP